MANLDNPRGARPYGDDLGSSPYKHATSSTVAIYPGDFVKTSGGYVLTATAVTDRLRGVAKNYAAASSSTTVYVWDNPDQKFVIQDDASATLTQTAVGKSGDVLLTTGDTTLKLSKHEIIASDLATTDGQLRVIGLADTVYTNDVINAWGVNADLIIQINEHERTVTGSATITGT